jgi:hypothetical protein
MWAAHVRGGGICFLMQQLAPRASQSDGLRHARSSVPQQPSTSQAKHEADAPSHAPNWSASKAIVWVFKGWWNSAAWWACFACGLFFWCFAYAKADDGSDFSSTLPFLIYFTRVRLSSRNPISSLLFFCTQTHAWRLQVVAGFAVMRLMIGFCWTLSWRLVLSKFGIFREVFG